MVGFSSFYSSSRRPWGWELFTRPTRDGKLERHKLACELSCHGVGVGEQFSGNAARVGNLLAKHTAYFGIGERLELPGDSARFRNVLANNSTDIGVFECVELSCVASSDRDLLADDPACQYCIDAIDSRHRNVLAGNTAGFSCEYAINASDGNLFPSHPARESGLDAEHARDGDILASDTASIRDDPTNASDACCELCGGCRCTAFIGSSGRVRAIPLHHLYRGDRVHDSGKDWRRDACDLHDIQFSWSLGSDIRFGGRSRNVPDPFLFARDVA